MKRIQDSHRGTICASFVLLLSIWWKSTTGKKISRNFDVFLSRRDGQGPRQFQGDHMNDIPFVADLLLFNILLYDFDNVEVNNIEELARRSVRKHENTVRLLRCNNHICYVSNVNSVFQSVRCPSCDTFSKKTFNLGQHVTTYSERVKSLYPKNVYQAQKTMFESWKLLELNTVMSLHFSKI